jgi:hypothetical protein
MVAIQPLMVDSGFCAPLTPLRGYCATPDGGCMVGSITHGVYRQAYYGTQSGFIIEIYSRCMYSVYTPTHTGLSQPNRLSGW